MTDLLGLDMLYLVPAGLPPHKSLPPGSPSPRQRLDMTRMAAWQIGIGDRARALDLELSRAGKSYTSQTVEAVAKLHPDAELWLLVGTDMFLTLPYWHEPETILSRAGIAAFSRTEADTEALFSKQREDLYRAFPQARIFTVDVPEVVEISSTEIREQLERGEGGKLLPPTVYGYILRQGLYNTHTDLKNLPLRTLRPVALSCLHGKRIAHVLGTEQEAVRLSVRYGADIEKAQQAALLHDCTKNLNPESQLQLCERYNIELDEMERRERKLHHALTGAALAREMFGVDEEIAGAIRYHTTGRADMTKLEKILYLADFIEPSRDFPGVEKLRAKCYEDLDAGLKLGLTMTARFVAERGGTPHPNTLAALRQFSSAPDET